MYAISPEFAIIFYPTLASVNPNFRANKWLQMSQAMNQLKSVPETYSNGSWSIDDYKANVLCIPAGKQCFRLAYRVICC